jgi:predicted amidohydrolase YtcJ
MRTVAHTWPSSREHADFVVLSQDLLQAAPTDIRNTRVLLTVMGGRQTYRSPDF